LTIPPIRLAGPGRTTIAGAPEGFDALVVAELSGGGRDVLFVARDDARLARMGEAIGFFAPEIECLEIPAWDCLPYDRVSPNPAIVSRRIDTFCRLAAEDRVPGRRVILTTVSALLQLVPPPEAFSSASMTVGPGDRVELERLTAFLVGAGYVSSDTVREPGEFAVRGGIVDVFPTGRAEPVRIDFFGDDVDSLRTFDAVSQRTIGQVESIVLRPVSEVLIDAQAIERFRSRYRELFGVASGDDPLYEAVSVGRRHLGMEHWLALFHERLETVAAYVPEAAIVLDHRAEEARDTRIELIPEYYAARTNVAGTGFGTAGITYNPVPPERMYLDIEGWERLLDGRPVAALSPFATETAGDLDAGGRPGVDFAESRLRAGINVFDAVAERVSGHAGEGRRVLVTAATAGSRDRLAAVFAEHGIHAPTVVDGWAEALAMPPGGVALPVLDLERGFLTDSLAVITEQDILGDKLTRPPRKRTRAEAFITEASSLTAGDLVVHVDHGIGRYEGLEAIEVAGAPHDCLYLTYAGGDKLYLPVENIELIGRYGSDAGTAQLDRLGGAAWQSRKARLKKRIRDMAERLIAVAAERTVRRGDVFNPPSGLFEEFCARFPYAETEDQVRAIVDTLDDLASGRPADRLICGDVGFGKTEVALRAAFIAAMDGRQVAVVVPTTLLCRQHFLNFRERFAGYPIRVEQISRLVSAKDAKAVRAGLSDGTVDIVIGTHALLAKDIQFRDLGLLVVDEEQHFGVAHKERLKAMKADVHVLTLTATPIPRTLQMALSGVREMSLIATPPVDRLAVRTFVLPEDPVVLREAILREHYRGGQTFYICPRIEDLADVAKGLAKLVPEVKVVSAHGRMPPRDLEATMTAFYSGRYDILLSTNIIESGLDLPAVNTIVIHRADMFGLAQLYQLRGRVGRSKTRAYAYLTLPPRKRVTPAAQKRLEVMQALDSLGAGFSLASHDLDIRGAGNLLGEEQSGHIREVGIELYQQMLEEAVAAARGGEGQAMESEWSPQIAIGLSVLIPDGYVPDLSVRLGLYRRLADVAHRTEIDAFAAELIDRFGELPAEVDNLLAVVELKGLCREAGVEKVDAGPRGAVVSFRGNDFANPAGLVAFITDQRGTAKLRPDHKLVYRRQWDDPQGRIAGIRGLMSELSRIAAAA